MEEYPLGFVEEWSEAVSVEGHPVILAVSPHFCTEQYPHCFEFHSISDFFYPLGQRLEFACFDFWDGCASY